MQDDQEEQAGEAAEATDDTTAEADSDDGAAAEDAATAEAVDVQASSGGAGDTVLKQPEVPDDANATIAAAQEHIDSLNMDEERKAAERAQKAT